MVSLSTLETQGLQPGSRAVVGLEPRDIKLLALTSGLRGTDQAAYLFLLLYADGFGFVRGRARDVAAGIGVERDTARHALRRLADARKIEVHIRAVGRRPYLWRISGVRADAA